MALSAFAFPACSSVDEGPDGIVPEYGDDIIRFATPTIALGTPEVLTRATLLNAVAVNTTFGVFGYCVPYSATGDEANWANGTTEWAGKKAFSHADVMYNQPIYYDGAKCVYHGHENDPDLPKHWYTQEDVEGNTQGTVNFEQFRYTFIAYHPYNVQGGDGGFSIMPADAATRGVPQLTYMMPYPAGTDRTQVLDIDAGQDVMWAMKTDHMPGNGAVELEFRHVLTGLRLQINNYNPVDNADPEANSVIIHSLALEGDFYRSATIDFTPAIPEMTVSGEQYSGIFRFMEDDAQWKVPANSSRIVGTPEKADGTTILLLPNVAATASGPNDAVPYLGTNKTITVTYSYAGDAVPTTKHVRNFSLGRVPEQGICYTLNLNFIGNQLLLMFTADSIEYWDAGSDNDIIIN